MNYQTKPEATSRPARLLSTTENLLTRHRRLALGAVAALVLLTGAVGLWWQFSAPAVASYASLPVSRGTVTESVTSTGTVNPVLTITVGSYVSGVIQNLFCDYNAQVRAGQICAKIDPRPFQATLDQYAGQLMRDRATLEKDRTDLTRYQKLEAQNAIARQQAEDQAYTVNQDEATAKLDEAQVEGAKLNLEYTDIVSPVDGIVVSRNVTQGQTVASTFQTPTLFLIATNLRKMQIDTNVSESDVGGMKEGDRATFTVDAYPNRVFRGVVTQIRQSPQTVQNVVTYDAVIAVDNNDLALKPGMTASTQIVTREKTGVVRVPNQALRFVPTGSSPSGAAGGAGPQAQSHVWVLRAGEPVRVPLVLGLSDGTFTEVVSGDLRPEDQVITAETREPQGHPGVPQPRL